MAKLTVYDGSKGGKLYLFHCPGGRSTHVFYVGAWYAELVVRWKHGAPDLLAVAALQPHGGYTKALPSIFA